MFKKHIATANTYTSRIPLEKRREALRSLVQHPNGLSNGNTHDKKKTSAAIDHFQISTNIPPIQRSTNARLADVESLLKTVFKFQNMTFSNFGKNHEALFKQRFNAIQQPGSNSQMTPGVYDSDSEEKSHSKVTQKDIMKLLRLYLRLSIRIKELEKIPKNNSPQIKNTVSIICYPRSSEEKPRSVIENSYSEVEAYVFKTSENPENLVLSKSSWIYQKQVYGYLFETTDTASFLDTFKTVFQEINNPNLSTNFNPYHYNDILKSSSFSSNGVDNAAVFNQLLGSASSFND